jgi:PAS domain-containing protein
MTQYDLAQIAKIPLITVQKIEQGRQVNLKSDMILNLAEAFNLSSQARQTFFLASLGIPDNSALKNYVEPEEALTELTHLLSSLHIPAFILDGFGDIVAVNPSCNELCGLKTSQTSSSHLLSQHNINRFLFSPEFKEQLAAMEAAQPGFSRHIVMLYKLWTLKNRNHWYFQRLLPELNRYPVFRQHWQSPSFHNEDIFIQHSYFNFKHPKFGSLKFLSTPIQAMTAQGDLNLFSFQPTDLHTAEACVQLAKELGTQAIHIACWPKPPHPTNLF